MDDAGLDVALIKSKQNVKYLLGGYRFLMFDYRDASGSPATNRSWFIRNVRRAKLRTIHTNATNKRRDASG